MKKFDYANLSFLSDEDMKNLEEIAGTCETFEDFQIAVGWANWMYDFADIEEGDCYMADTDSAIIDEVLKKVFNAVKGN